MTTINDIITTFQKESKEARRLEALAKSVENEDPAKAEEYHLEAESYYELARKVVVENGIFAKRKRFLGRLGELKLEYLLLIAGLTLLKLYITHKYKNNRDELRESEINTLLKEYKDLKEHDYDDY